MRTFLALDLDPALLEAAAAIAASAQSAVPRLRARWTSAEAWHVTVRFFGEVDDGLRARLEALPARLAVGPAPRVRFDALDGFPQLRRARVLVLSLAEVGGASLAAVASEAEAAAVALGFPPEGRAYRPHLTLARLREPADLRPLVRAAAVRGEGSATALALYGSTLGPTGARYDVLARSSFPR